VKKLLLACREDKSLAAISTADVLIMENHSVPPAIIGVSLVLGLVDFKSGPRLTDHNTQT